MYTFTIVKQLILQTAPYQGAEGECLTLVSYRTRVLQSRMTQRHMSDVFVRHLSYKTLVFDIPLLPLGSAPYQTKLMKLGILLSYFGYLCLGRVS